MTASVIRSVCMDKFRMLQQIVTMKTCILGNLNNVFFTKLYKNFC